MPKLPHVTINMAMSADGKISTCRRESFTLGTSEDRYQMDALRARADAVVIGSGTLAKDPWALRVRDPALRQGRRARRRDPHPLNVVLSSRLDLKTSAHFFTFRQTDKLVITTRQAPAARIKRIGRVAEVVVLPRRSITPLAVLGILAERGARRVLVEGGGRVNYSFFDANLVDEIYITVTPRILGGADAPTVVDGKGFVELSQRHLELVSAKRRGGEVFLRYRVVRS